MEETSGKNWFDDQVVKEKAANEVAGGNCQHLNKLVGFNMVKSISCQKVLADNHGDAKRFFP